MALPWLAAIAVEWLVLRRFFASDLVGRGETDPGATPAGPRLRRRGGACSPSSGSSSPPLLHVAPAFAALAGAVALAVPALARRRAGP